METDLLCDLDYIWRFNRTDTEWKRYPRSDPLRGRDSIEPIRNGNMMEISMLSSSTIQSNRYGMETNPLGQVPLAFMIQSNRYGMETSLFGGFSVPGRRIQSNRYGMETGDDTLPQIHFEIQSNRYGMETTLHGPRVLDVAIQSNRYGMETSFISSSSINLSIQSNRYGMETETHL